ncbi:DinB family protein [Wenyingzhuangia sp. 1_MG-2023]|nr:DinB family protein [Wenyingzhuangia sp. 1_MG-2023]
MIEDIVKNLEKGKYLLSNITDDKYSNKSIPPYYSSIGAHTRHVLDMFQCIFIGVDKQYVDFTKRERNLEVETYTLSGIEYFDKIINCLKKLQESELKLTLEVADDLGSGKVVVTSTLGAMLSQAHCHAIHHYASVGYLMHILEIYLPIDGFGINATTPKEKPCLHKDK